MWKNTTAETAKTTRSNKKATWAENLSNIRLTEAQEHLLAHGLDLAIAPSGDNIAAVEQAWQKLTQVEADELWVEVKSILMKDQSPDLTSTGMKRGH